MSTRAPNEVTARLRAARSYTMVEDITDVAILEWVDHATTGQTTIVFAADLPDDVASRVRDRMLAADPADEARRTWLRDIDPSGLANAFEILRAILLDEDPPEPTYPTTSPEATP